MHKSSWKTAGAIAFATLRGFAFILALAATPASAQTAAPEYPTRPIRMVVPFAPGGGADLSARVIADALGKRLGQPVFVDNKAGAGGIVGAQAVATAAPDGQTLIWGTPGLQMTNPYLVKNLPYDPQRAFAAVAPVALVGSVLVVHKDLPVKSVAELIALARAKPGSISYGSAGIGASSHLAGELFRTAAGIDIVHVPYKGSSAAMIDIIGGRVSMAIDSISAYLPQIRAGTVRALAVSSLERNPALLDLPPIADTLPGFEASPINYVAVPAGTPAPIIARLNRELNAIVATPEVREAYRESGTITRGGSAADMEALIRGESAKWQKVIEQAGITPQ